MVKKRGHQRNALPAPEEPLPPAAITPRRATTPLDRFKRWLWGFVTHYLPMFFFMMWLLRMSIKIQPLMAYFIYGDVNIGDGTGNSCRGVPHVDTEPIAYELISTEDFSHADESPSYASLLEYFTKINREPNSAMGWYAVGLALSPEGEGVELRGRSYNRRQCFVRALEKNPRMISAWNNLARLLKPRKSITLQNGEVIVQEEETVEIGGQTFTIKQCHVNALELDETFGVTWGNLGTYLFTNATDFAVVSGTSYTGKECLVRALEWDPELHPIWNNLGTTLRKGGDENGGVDETVKVSGETYDRMQCYVRALEINPAMYETWTNVGSNLISNHDTIQINGIHISKLQCFIKSLEINPGYLPAWVGLTIFLSETETVQLQGKVIDKEFCIRKQSELTKIIDDVPTVSK